MRCLLLASVLALSSATPTSAAYLIFDFEGTGTRGIDVTTVNAFFAFNPALAVQNSNGTSSFQWDYQNLHYSAVVAGNDIDFSFNDGQQPGLIHLTFQSGYLQNAFPLPLPEFRGYAPGEDLTPRLVSSSFTTTLGGRLDSGQITNLGLRYFNDTYPTPSIGFRSGLALPEPGTWATMLLGFAGIGLAMRRRRPSTTVDSRRMA